MKRNRHAAAQLALLLVALAGATLVACGGGSSSGPATVKTTPGRRGHLAERIQAVRNCLKRNGVTLPRDETAKSAGSGNGGSSAAPRATSAARLKAAEKKCGLSSELARAADPEPPTPPKAPNSGAQIATKFVECLRANGVKIPKSRVSAASGLSLPGVDLHSARFKAAEVKCMRVLSAAGTAGR